MMNINIDIYRSLANARMEDVVRSHDDMERIKVKKNRKTKRFIFGLRRRDN